MDRIEPFGYAVFMRGQLNSGTDERGSDTNMVCASRRSTPCFDECGDSHKTDLAVGEVSLVGCVGDSFRTWRARCVMFVTIREFWSGVFSNMRSL
jgi:hypothetical protein